MIVIGTRAKCSKKGTVALRATRTKAVWTPRHYRRRAGSGLSQNQL